MSREGCVPAADRRSMNPAPVMVRTANHHYILDHIRPIAMGGDQWAKDNLQVLCVRCNTIKTARDMGNIARWKKYHGRGRAHQEDNSRQVLLFQKNSVE